MADAIPLASQEATFSVIDFQSTRNFSFSFTTPIAPLSGIYQSVLQISGELADGGRGGISALPFSTTAIAQALVEGTGVIDQIGMLSVSPVPAGETCTASS